MKLVTLVNTLFLSNEWVGQVISSISVLQPQELSKCIAHPYHQFAPLKYYSFTLHKLGNLSRPRRVATHCIQRCKNPWFRVAVTTKFLILASKACASSIWTLLHVTVLASIILRCFVDFFKKLCTTAIWWYQHYNNVCSFTFDRCVWGADWHLKCTTDIWHFLLTHAAHRG
jgi:hypothetical protein